MKTQAKLLAVNQDMRAAAPADQLDTATPQPPRTLLVIGAEVQPERQQQIAAGRYPRKDYFELARVLQADILDWPSTQETALSRLLARRAGMAVAQAWLAFRARRRYQVIYSDSERVGMPLAILLKLSRSRTRHVMLAHLLSPWKKRFWFRWARIHSHIDRILCHASLQRQIMIDQMKIPAEKIALMPYQADERFWRPMSALEARAALEPAPEEQAVPLAGQPPLICSVGLEFRDYPTLMEAVRGMDVQVEIAAASFWSDHQGISASETLPPNVHVSAHD